jgi:tripartite-type tricarboxylate transporter receptor subunit TctC
MKTVLVLACAGFIFLGGSMLGNGIRAAEKYPVKPISFIIPLGPGSDFEIVIRPWLQKVSEVLKKPVIVVHKAGAGSTIGYREIYGAKPDGYTIGAFVGSMLSLKLQGLFPYDYHDYTIINTVASMSPAIVATTRGKRPFKTIEALLGFAKANPGEVTLATVPIGQTFWVGTMYFQERMGLKFNIIPQEEGAGMVATQVAGGHADIGVLGLPAAKGQIDAGNLCLLAVIGSQRGYEPYHYAPTLKELGHDVVFRAGASGIIGPPKMPKEIVDTLHNAFKTTLTPEIQKHLLKCDQVPFFMRSDEALQRLDAEREVMKGILGRAGLLKGT